MFVCPSILLRLSMGKHGEAVSGTMHGDVFADADLFHYDSDMCRQRTVGNPAENFLVIVVLVMPDNLQGDVQQLHLIRDLRLVTFGDNPHRVSNLNDIRTVQFLDVDK